MANLGRSDVHYYDSTMGSAPALSNAAGSLKAIIKACLIDGFGDELPQGSWEMPYEDTHRAAFRSLDTASTRMYLYINDSLVASKSYARVNGYETMSDIDAGVNIFGTYLSNPLYWMKASSATSTRVWQLIANNSAFYLLTRWDLGTTNYEGYFFGDILSVLPTDSYRCAIIGSTVDMAYPGGNAGGQNNFSVVFHQAIADNLYNQGSALARNYLGTLGAIPIFKSTQGVMGYSVAWMADRWCIETPYPDPVTGTVRVDKVWVGEVDPANSNRPGWFRGEMPGMYAPLHRRQPSSGTTVSTVPDARGHSLKFFKMGYAADDDQGRVGIDITGPWDYGIFASQGTLGISGTVTEMSVPGAYRVCLYRQSDGSLVRETWSGNDGTYAFTGLSDGSYTIIAFDHTDPLRPPATQTNVVPS